MDIFDLLLLIFTPVGWGLLIGIAASYVACNYTPLSNYCTPVAAAIIGVGFVVGAGLTLLQARNRRTRDGN